MIGGRDGQPRPARSAHARFSSQGADSASFGKKLRLDHCPRSSRSSGYWSLDFLRSFQGLDELLVSGIQDLRLTLDSALQHGKKSAKRHEGVVAFSCAMFDHADGYRNVYHALLNTRAWPVVRERLQDVIEELIRRECKAEVEKLKKATSDVPVDLFVHYLTATFFAVLMWWLDRRSRLTPSQIDEVFRSLVLPTVHTVLA
jgi:hypothetical protein